MKNLNKKNFFDELKVKYPEAMETFCKWIDDFKALHGWNDLFNSNSDFQNAQGKNAEAPKFHDLPYELQYGIMLRFFFEERFIALQHPDDAAAFFEMMFRKLNDGDWYFSHKDSSPGIDAMLRRRLEQINIKEYNDDHDKGNNEGELIDAGIAIVLKKKRHYPKWWSEDFYNNYKKLSYKDRVAVAGALFAAEYDRLEYAEKIDK